MINSASLFFRTLRLLLLVLPVFPLLLSAQTDSLFRHNAGREHSYEVFKTNPLAVLLGPSVITSEYGLHYEFSLGNKSALSLGASLLNKNIFIYLSEKLDTNATSGNSVVQIQPRLKISGYRMQAQYKWLMPLYHYPCALYIGPNAAFSTVYFSYQQRGYTRDFYKIIHRNLSLIVGYQHVVSGKLFIDLYAGLGYKNNYVREYSTPATYTPVPNEFIFTGIPGHVKISMGYYLGYRF